MWRARPYFAVTIVLLLIFNIAVVFQSPVTVHADTVKVLDLNMGDESNVLTDKSGNGYDATVVSDETAPAGVFRVPVNDAVVFDTVYCRDFEWKTNNSSSSKTYGMIGDTTNGTTLGQYFTHPVTVSTWVYLPPNAGGNILTCYSSTFKINATASGTSYVMYVYRTFTSGGSWKASTASLPSNTWTQFVMTYDPTTTAAPKMYINGASTGVANNAAASGTQTAIDPTKPVIVGNQMDGNSTYNLTRPFKGRIGSMKVYNGILSAQDVLNAYTNEKDDFTGWKFESRIFNNDSVRVPTANLNSVPVTANKIDVILEPQSGFAIDSSTANSNNIQLVNADTGVAYQYTGSYDPATKTYTMSNFGYLEYGSNYQVVISNIKYTNSQFVRSAPQIVSFKTAMGLNVESKTYTNAAGDPIQSLVGQTHVNVSYQVKNYLNTAQKAVLIVGLFKGDILVDIASGEKNVAASTPAAITCGLDLPADAGQGGYQIKTFLCDDLGLLHVLANNSEFE